MSFCRPFIPLLFLSLAAEVTAPPSRPADDLAAIEVRLPGLRARVAELEVVLYQTYPMAQPAEKHVAELRQVYEQKHNRGTAALRTLPNPAEASAQYAALRADWNGVSAPETLKDPIVGPVIKALLLSSPAVQQREIDRLVAADPTLRREDLADADVFWRTVISAAEKAVPESRRRFDEAVKRANFPDWVVAEAKTDAVYQGKIEMLDTWLNFVTPADLKAARRQLANDEGLARALRLRAAARLSINLRFSPQQELLVTFQNTAQSPLVVNLGEMLGNGKQLLPSHIRVVITDRDKKQRIFTTGGPAGVAGRVDDWLIPLRPGESYVLCLKLGEFAQEKTFERYQPQPGDLFSVRFEGVPPGHDNNGSLIPGLPVFLGPVESRAIPGP